MGGCATPEVGLRNPRPRVGATPGGGVYYTLLRGNTISNAGGILFPLCEEYCPVSRRILSALLTYKFLGAQKMVKNVMESDKIGYFLTISFL